MKVGDQVRWTSSNTAKEGVVIAIVPPGMMPKDIGYPKLGLWAGSRDHESYIVQGTGKLATKFYWPVVSLLNKPIPRSLLDAVDREDKRA
jgi:hypothetical protein